METSLQLYPTESAIAIVNKKSPLAQQKKPTGFYVASGLFRFRIEAGLLLFHNALSFAHFGNNFFLKLGSDQQPGFGHLSQSH